MKMRTLANNLSCMRVVYVCCLFLFVFSASLRGGDYPELEDSIESPAQSYYDENVSTPDDILEGGIQLRAIGGDDEDEDDFEEGGGNENTGLFNDAPVGNGIFILIAFIALYAFGKWRKEKMTAIYGK